MKDLDLARALAEIPADNKCGLKSKKAAAKALAAIHAELQELQIALHAEHKRGVLIVLQGMDASGKDGAIRKVFGPLNAHWLSVTDFKAPTRAELDRDYLWRVHHAIPKRGMIGIFNRSHYEDVLIARVRKLASHDEIEERYRQINQFESHLCENGYVILKFYLHISKAEQRARLQARIDEPLKRWKHSDQDLEERKLWTRYMAAYRLMLSRCGTIYAPWHIVPADRKWVRNIVIGRAVVEAMRAMSIAIPKPQIGEIKVK